jgi:uncharacterized protein (TIGR03067 family)
LDCPSNRRHLNSIAVTFAVDEHSYLKYQRLLQKHEVKGPGSAIDIGLADENGFPHKGTLKGFDNEVDPNTGTVRADAALPNTDRLFLQGMFVRIRMAFGPLQRVLEVPEEAVLIDQGKRYLLVVASDDIVERREVLLGAASDNMRIIAKGLSADDWIVIGSVGGPHEVTPGTHVKRRIIDDVPKEKKRLDKDKLSQKGTPGDTPPTPATVAQEKTDNPALVDRGKSSESALVSPKAEDIVWGREVDGLQAGVGVINANSIHIGGKAWFVVELRNVSKAAIKVSVWPQSYPGIVDAAGKPVRATTAPMPLFDIIPKDLTVQPGQTVDLFRTDINIAEERMGDLPAKVPDGVAYWLMIHVRPGQYKANFGGFLLNHPSLSTGAVEFEVKAASDKVTPEATPPTSATELAKFQGTWVLISSERNGQNTSEERNPFTLTFTGNKWKVHRGDEVAVEGTVRLVDVAATPKKFDLIKPSRLAPETSVDYGVYDWKDAMLRYCVRNGPFDPGIGVPDLRPSDFTTRDGDGRTVYLWKRAQPLPPPPRPEEKKSDSPVTEQKTPPNQEPEREKEDFVAWGKEVAGLQAGLGYRPGEHRVYHHGETVTLIVRIRNAGKEKVKFQYLRKFFIENPPTVTDGGGKPIPLDGVTTFGLHIPEEVNLAPGKEIELYELKLELKPASEGANYRLSTLYGTGKFQIQYERVIGNSSSGTITLDPTKGKLATGKLELEIKSPPPAASKFPVGWGGGDDDYEISVDRAVRHGGRASGTIKSIASTPLWYGALAQAFKADKFRGQRLRMTAYVKSNDVENSAGLWMRIESFDGKGRYSISSDFMGDRPVKGTNDWKQYEVVMDVPKEGAAHIYFGVLLAGKGQVWVDDFKFEAVGNDVKTTGRVGETGKATAEPAKGFAEEPRNLDFEQ